MSALTSADMIAMLRRHYIDENRPPSGVFAPEIQSPCGTRRADLIWLSTAIAGGRKMIGHEVKVSRSDVMVELRDPAKADPWAQFCNEWWLVISDPALIDGLDIPESWGIMSPPSGRRTRSMTVLRKAPKLTPSNAADGVARVTAWLNTRHAELTNTQEQTLRYRDQAIERLETQVREMRDGAPRDMSPAMKRVHEITRKVEKELRKDRVWGSHPTDAEIVAALVDLTKFKSTLRDLGYAVRNAKDGIERARGLVNALPEIDSDDPLDLGNGAA